MELSQQISLENKQILSQTQIQSLEILAMDAVELEEFLQNEYMSNPLLEYSEDHGKHASIEAQKEREETTTYFDADEGYRGRAFQKNDAEPLDVRENLTASDPDYMKRYFLTQIRPEVFSTEEWKLAAWMVDCLEDNGFFSMSIEEVCALTGHSAACAEKVLAVLRDLEPFGVFAPDLSACLLKQLEVSGTDDPDLALLVREFLPELSEGKISVISRKTGLSTAQIRKYMAKIAQLNPRPLGAILQAEVSYIVPDIIYTRKDGHWEIAINDTWSGEYHVNEYYLSLMRSAKDPELSDYFKKKLERTRFILNSIAQRKVTMTAIAKLILEKQEAYFLGTGKLAPMTMCQLAKELDVHPSTISRAVKAKYIKSPAGTILIKKLFCHTVSCEEGEEMSAASVKEKIRELVDGEDKRRPYSDAKLVELLLAQGVHISRRAVAKYRDELWIKSSFDRKIR